MGTITASAIIAGASEIAVDEDNVLWTLPNALNWLNDAQRALAVVRPDSSVKRNIIQLVAGTAQTITGRRIMAVIRNMGDDGLTAGDAIRLIERGSLDDLDPAWHSAAGETSVDEWIYDVKVPKSFFVNPPVHASTAVYIELDEAVNPTDCAEQSSTIDVDDVYAPVLTEWILYRFFARDSEETPNYARAMTHYKSFFSMLGLKTNMEMKANPKTREHLK
ncbi:MAG: hypothetical protein KAS93_07920 [Gammaproteobacteria bacterium]|nr:hypothetical protein [Gammaproteobacteria bacterium]